jgi:hypothetical protein
MACVGRVALSEEERIFKHCGAERDRNRTVTQDTQQKESEIKKKRMKVSGGRGLCTRSEFGMGRKSYLPSAEMNPLF